MKKLPIIMCMLLFSSVAYAQTQDEGIFMMRTAERVGPAMAQEMGEDDVLGVKNCLVQCFMMLYMTHETNSDESTCYGYIKEKGLGDPLCKNVTGKTKMAYLKARSALLGY